MASVYTTRTATPRLRPGPSGLPRGQVTEIQRSRMLAAAVEAVEEVGYARMTVAQVIGRARVSRKTFYDVFADREDCFLAAFDQAIDQAGALAKEAYEQESGWRDGIRAGLARLLMLMDDEPGLAKLCVVEALGAGPSGPRPSRQVLEELAAVIDRGRASRARRKPAAGRHCRRRRGCDLRGGAHAAARGRQGAAHGSARSAHEHARAALPRCKSREQTS